MKTLFLYPFWTGETKGISRYFAKASRGTYIPYNLALLAAITKKYNSDVIVLTGMTPFYTSIFKNVERVTFLIYYLNNE